MDNEEFEQIPWSQLLAEADDGKRRTLYVIAGVVVALVVGAAAARSFRGPQATVVPLPEEVVAPQVPAVDGTASTPLPVDEPPGSTAPLGASGLLSEADLMAVLPGEGTRAAVTAAEMFVTEYFTVDGAATSGERLAMVVPPNLEVSYPHATSGNRISYVEWARAVRAETIGDGRYAVTVAYGSVAAGEGEPISRLPARAVEVDVLSDGTGAVRIHGLPRPLDFEAYGGAEVEVVEPPALVAAAALDKARVLGDEATVVSAYRSGGGWDVVVAVVDPASGHRWPLAFHVDG